MFMFSGDRHPSQDVVPAVSSLALEWPEHSREQDVVQGECLQQEPPVHKDDRDTAQS